MELTELTQDLMRPGAYSARVPAQAEAGAEVGLVQTHISLLFFAADRVYKVKKPVDLEFLDFTRLDDRRRFCEDEVRLNRRLAPAIYLGTVPIVRGDDGHLVVGGEGEPLEWAVEMVRLPEGRMFASMLERGEIDNEQMNELASLLARFHAACPTGPGVDEHGSPAAVRANDEQNFEQLGDYEAGEAALGVLSRTQRSFLRRRRRRFLEDNAEFLERRVREGRVREGHGDLHTGNLCFVQEAPDDAPIRDRDAVPAGIVAYDCIEFSSAFRCGDVAVDLAFLAMDLDQRGFPAFSSYLVRRYAELAQDPEIHPLVGFYKGYRALVRAKVAALTASDPALGDARREELRREAMRYVQLAAAYELPPAMVLMCGLPATGKSWLARRLAGPLRAALVHSDVRRKLLAGMQPTTSAGADYGEGLYTPARKRETYGSLLEGAIESLRAGHSVVVDATFSSREYRSLFVDAATRLGLPYYIVHVTAPDEVVRERLALRAQDPHEASDAGIEVYERAVAAFEAPAEVPSGHLLELASGQVPEEQSSRLVDRMIELAGCEWESARMAAAGATPR